MPLGPRCFRWRLEMPSGPVELVFFDLAIALAVSSDVKGQKLWSIGIV